MARSWGFYADLLPNATSLAAHQGYAGARWLKMLGLANPLLDGVGGARAIDVAWIGHDARPPGVSGSLLLWDTANDINPVLVWQQPHVIWLADAQRRAAGSGPSGSATAAAAVVAQQAPLVLATADYLSARFYRNASAGAFMLGPPVLGGQECGDPTRTFNPVFELVYSALALDIANDWREALGLPRSALYDAVAGGLPPLHTDPAAPPGAPRYTFDDGCVCQLLAGGARNASCRAEWVPAAGSNCPALAEHPLMLGVLGMVNGRAHGDRYGVSAATANNTLAGVWGSWGQWKGAWGWDDSLLASAMARLGWDPRAIVEGPLSDAKFPYWKNGHTLCCPVYLPGNGGLLLSVALLAAGSDTSPPMHFPREWGAVGEGFDVPYP
jgi:hypothetical protein